MAFKKVFWAAIIVVGVFFLWLMYPQKETTRPEKTGDVNTGVNVRISDGIIAKTTRLILRQAVNFADFEKMKRAAVEKIRKKTDKAYNREMKRIFDDAEYMGIKDTFGLTRNSSREEVIRVIEDIDKDTILKRLDEVPDQAIAKLIKKKLREQELNSIEQLKDFLDRKIYKLVKVTSG